MDLVMTLTCLLAGAGTAIYIDGGQSGVTAEGNIFFKSIMGFFGNTGSDFHVNNNLFMDVQEAVAMPGVNVTFGKASPSATLTSYFNLLNKFPFRGELWQTRYPELARFKDWTDPLDPPPGCLEGAPHALIFRAHALLRIVSAHRNQRL